MAFQKRILKDLKGFTKDPIANCFVRMCQEDITCWDAFIILDLDGKPCPLHMSIRFPQDYPRTAPSAGFSCSDFGYNQGAVYVEKDRESHFYGKLIICLDILGNFAQVHDEWAKTANSGWSPAYTISSLLCNVLVTLTECTSALSSGAKQVLLGECMDFLKTFGDTSDLLPSFDRNTLSAVAPAEPTVVPPPSSEEQKQDATALPSTFAPLARTYLAATTKHFSGMLTTRGEPPSPQLLDLASAISDRLGALLQWHHAKSSEVQAVQSCLEGAGWAVRDRAPTVGTGHGALSLGGLLAALIALDQKLSTSSSSSSSKEDRCDTTSALAGLCISDPDSTIACWYSFEHYTESILGVGIALVRGKVHTTLSTDGELISISAFEEGLRQTPTKTPFEYFLPAWITPRHSTGSLLSCGRDWEQALVKSTIQIGNCMRALGENKLEVSSEHVNVEKLEGSALFATCVLRVYSDLINSLVVKIMQPESDVRASERIFRVLIDCWRTLYWFKTRFACVSEAVVERVKSFTEHQNSRNKKMEPNVGCLLALRTVVSESEVPMLDFFHAYIEESFLRGVMWWKKGGVSEEPRAVFEATKVSRRLFLFQSLFLSGCVTSDLEGTAALADSTECKLSDRLDTLLASFKHEVSLEESRLSRGEGGKGVATALELYRKYYEACHCPYPAATTDLPQLSGWISTNAQHAAVTPGYFFSNNSNRSFKNNNYRGGRGEGRGAGGYRNNRW